MRLAQAVGTQPHLWRIIASRFESTLHKQRFMEVESMEAWQGVVHHPRDARLDLDSWGKTFMRLEAKVRKEKLYASCVSVVYVIPKFTFCIGRRSFSRLWLLNSPCFSRGAWLYI